MEPPLHLELRAESIDDRRAFRLQLIDSSDSSRPEEDSLEADRLPKPHAAASARTLDDIASLGAHLADCLLPPRIRAALYASLQRCSGGSIRLALHMPAKLEKQPWELI